MRLTNLQKAAKLREARALIDAPEKWWDGKGDNWSTPTSCVVQATARAMNHWLSLKLDTELAVTLNLRGNGYNAMVKYNDTHTHAEVLDLFDRTIERLETL